MKIFLFVVCAAAFLTSGAVAADEDAVVADKDTQESKPIELSAAQMDQITAGTLQLNNGTGGKLIFENFDNPAPNFAANFCDGSGPFCHPALTRRSLTAADHLLGTGATAGHGPSVAGLNDGPWVATAASPMITCVGISIPDGAGGTGSGCTGP